MMPANATSVSNASNANQTRTGLSSSRMAWAICARKQIRKIRRRVSEQCVVPVGKGDPYLKNAKHPSELALSNERSLSRCHIKSGEGGCILPGYIVQNASFAAPLASCAVPSMRSIEGTGLIDSMTMLGLHGGEHLKFGLPPLEIGSLAGADPDRATKLDKCAGSLLRRERDEKSDGISDGGHFIAGPAAAHPAKRDQFVPWNVHADSHHLLGVGCERARAWSRAILRRSSNALQSSIGPTVRTIE